MHFNLVPTLHGLGSFVLGVLSFLLLFSPLLRGSLAFLLVLNWPLFSQIWVGMQSEVSRELGRRMEIGRNLVGTSFEVDPLFLFTIKPLKSVLYFKSMPSSSSSNLVVT